MARLSLAALVATVFMSTSTSAYMGPTMGELNDCDDGKSNLEVDWNPKDFTQFTCRNDLHYAVQDLDPIYYEIPNFDATTDMVMHKCMNESISYPENPPLRGDHRPNWAVWGEYLFIPMQRWLHNLEHGAIVMLYHPCVDEGELGKLRDLVTGCLYRHIITPYNGLSERYPLMLIAWGARLQLNQVAEDDVVRFIRKHAHVAPEDLSKQGQYDFQLLLPSRVVSDIDDTNLCPNHGNSTSMLGGNSVESRRD